MAANTEFPKATYQQDPYRNFKFRLKWDGKYVAGISKVSGLTRTTKVNTQRSSGDPSTPIQLPGRTSGPPITLEWGVTHDVAFEQWANKVWDYHNTSDDDQKGEASNEDVTLKDFRKDIILEIFNEAGQKALAYNLYKCWPSKFTAQPEMDGNGNAVAIQSLVLENDGWERDTSIKELAAQKANSRDRFAAKSTN